jgi:hypothetical protein
MPYPGKAGQTESSDEANQNPGPEGKIAVEEVCDSPEGENRCSRRDERHGPTRDSHIFYQISAQFPMELRGKVGKLSCCGSRRRLTSSRAIAATGIGVWRIASQIAEFWRSACLTLRKLLFFINFFFFQKPTQCYTITE